MSSIRTINVFLNLNNVYNNHSDNNSEFGCLYKRKCYMTAKQLKNKIMSATKEKNSATANCEKKCKYTPPSKKKFAAKNTFY